MFFKKSRDAKKAAAAELRQSIVDDFVEKIGEAEKTADPGERVLKLQAVADSIDGAIADLSGDADKSAKMKQRLLFWTAMPAGIAVSAVYPPALIGLIGMGASVYGGNKLSGKFAQFARKKSLEKEQPFIDALEGVKAKALTAQDTLVIQDAPGIAKSKHFGDILANIPRLREQFAIAYGRKLAEEETAQKQSPASRPTFSDDAFKP